MTSEMEQKLKVLSAGYGQNEVNGLIRPRVVFVINFNYMPNFLL